MTLSFSAAIHILVIGQHFQEWWPAGVFFVLTAAAQIVCAFNVLRGAGRRSALFGALLSFMLVVTWVTSRTAGLPFGPAAGVSEAAAPLDIAATATEIITLVVFTAWVVRSNRIRIRVRGTSSRVATAAVLVLMTAIGIVGASRLPAGAHEHGASDSHHDIRNKIAVEGPARSPSLRPAAETSHGHDTPHAHNDR